MPVEPGGQAWIRMGGSNAVRGATISGSTFGANAHEAIRKELTPKERREAAREAKRHAARLAASGASLCKREKTREAAKSDWDTRVTTLHAFSARRQGLFVAHK